MRVAPGVSRRASSSSTSSPSASSRCTSTSAPGSLTIVRKLRTPRGPTSDNASSETSGAGAAQARSDLPSLRDEVTCTEPTTGLSEPTCTATTPGSCCPSGPVRSSGTSTAPPGGTVTTASPAGTRTPSSVSTCQPTAAASVPGLATRSVVVRPPAMTPGTVNDVVGCWASTCSTPCGRTPAMWVSTSCAATLAPREVAPTASVGVAGSRLSSSTSRLVPAATARS